MVYARLRRVLNDVGGDKQKITTGFSKVRTIAVTSGKVVWERHTLRQI